MPTGTSKLTRECGDLRGDGLIFADRVSRLADRNRRRTGWHRRTLCRRIGMRLRGRMSYSRTDDLGSLLSRIGFAGNGIHPRLYGVHR